MIQLLIRIGTFSFNIADHSAQIGSQFSRASFGSLHLPGMRISALLGNQLLGHSITDADCYSMMQYAPPMQQPVMI
jgi:hypothetical protein